MGDGMQDWQPAGYKDYRYIAAGPELLGGKLAIRGTRLSVSLILECLANDMFTLPLFWPASVSRATQRVDWEGAAVAADFDCLLTVVARQCATAALATLSRTCAGACGVKPGGNSEERRAPCS
ncbi:MAG: DUF433 domain-containing protein [Bryobacteraceae bacterium]